jgi:hypothetical protein
MAVIIRQQLACDPIRFAAACRLCGYLAKFPNSWGKKTYPWSEQLGCAMKLLELCPNSPAPAPNLILAEREISRIVRQLSNPLLNAAHSYFHQPAPHPHGPYDRFDLKIRHQVLALIEESF